MPDDLDSASIFSKVVGHKLSNGSSGYLYTRWRINFAADPVQIQTPQYMDMGFSAINTFDESSGLSPPATKIRKNVDGAHWSAHNRIFGEAKVVEMSETNSDYDYNYKT